MTEQTFDEVVDRHEELINEWWDEIVEHPRSVWEYDEDRLKFYIAQKAIIERYRRAKESEDNAA